MERLLKLAHTNRLTLVCVLVENFSGETAAHFLCVISMGNLQAGKNTL